MQGGESVLAYQTATGATGAFTVTDVISHDDTLVVALTLGDETLDTTPEHPFYAMLRGWVAASDLRVGDTVRRQDGSYGRVAAVAVEHRAARMYNLTVADAHTFFVGDDGWLVHNGSPCSLRDLYLGSTPSKSSGTGKRVIDRMMDEGKIRLSEDGERLEVFHPKAGWVDIDDTDMGHVIDAVSWWNSVGRYYGPKSAEVRAFMLNPDNYILEPYWINRSNGSILGKLHQYLPPVQR